MKVLIACEYSGRVRTAFKKKGHDTWSCDILPTEISGKHIQGDVISILNNGWDLMLAFPPCTHLSSSGAVYWPEKQKDGRQETAINFVKALFYSNIQKVCLENPVGILSTVWKKPQQIINPFEFGDPYRKRTCLWLKGLNTLIPSNVVKPIASWHSGSTRGGKKKDGTRTPSKLPVLYGGWKKRSLTFQGIADAMAEQWG